MNQIFSARLSDTSDAINSALEHILSDDARSGEQVRPPRLMAAMRHGVLNGGKRLRPFLMVECAALFGVARDEVVQAACALECLHCYSLVHDDLPAMDDDDLRRGKPTVHRAYDEATAILAGDGLLTLAFDLVADPTTVSSSAIRAELAHLLARAAGVGGMIGGQMLDLMAEGDALDESDIRILQSMKTGALIRYACEAGAVLGGASGQQRADLVRFGETIGLAFQLADDLLDVTSSEEAMGKAVGKDAVRGKGTLVGIRGTGKVREMLKSLLAEAEGSLTRFGEEASVLRDAAHYVVARNN